MLNNSQPNSDGEKLHQCLENAKKVYGFQNELYCPYLTTKIALTSDGFNHLQNKPNRQPRNIREQIVKLSLLRKALKIIPKCGTLQEYRERTEKVGKKSYDGFYKMKSVKYWGFHAIIDGKKRKIKVILKQVGDGKIIFWSVMLSDKKLYSQGIDED